MAENMVLYGAVNEYDSDLMDGIGHLMPQLDENFSDEPMSPEHFDRRFARNPERDTFVGVVDGQVVVTWVMNTLAEQHPNVAGYLGGFVVDEAYRGRDAIVRGVAVGSWPVMHQFCRDEDATAFALNTEEWRPEAIGLYKKMGMTQVEGTVGHFEQEVPERGITKAVPRDVNRGFFGNANVFSGPLGHGLVNRTFLASSGGRYSVLQELNDVFGEALVADSSAVTDHLTREGWDVQQHLPTQDGALTMRDNTGKLWRQLRFIEADHGIPQDLEPEQLGEIGGLLGRLHQSLAGLDYEPQFAIPHFHDTPYHADALRGVLDDLSSAESVELADNLLTAYEDLPTLPDTGTQLIHGDPQLTNILFRDGKPYTYIDFDTTMRGSIWVDIGDLLRATLEDDAKAGRPLDLTKLRPIVEGYRQAVRPSEDSDEFFQAALTATQLISLELAMRFVNDIADTDKTYFSWDESKFGNKHDNHMFRAGIQWNIYQELENLKGK